MPKSANWDPEADSDNSKHLFKKPGKNKKMKSKRKHNSKTLTIEEKLDALKSKVKNNIDAISHVSNKKQADNLVNTSANVSVKKKKRKLKQMLSQDEDVNENPELNQPSIKMSKIKNKLQDYDGDNKKQTKNMLSSSDDGKKFKKGKKRKHKQILVQDDDDVNENTKLIKKSKANKKQTQDLLDKSENNLDTINNVKKKKKNLKKLLPQDENINETTELDQPLLKKLKKKNKKKSKDQQIENKSESKIKTNPISNLKLKKKQQLFSKLQNSLNPIDKTKMKPILTLRQKMMEKLAAARFRFINEQIYTSDSKEAQKVFQEDPGAFKAYHDGYRKQVKRWPLNPLDVIIQSIKSLPLTHIIADFGCGDARLSKSVKQKVHSFDLVTVDDSVVACDMSSVPLDKNSVDVAVYCLSLMGTNLKDYLIEANRVLKIGGILKIAEVESRFDKIENFIEGVQRYGFKNTWTDLSHNLFYFLDFQKERDIKHKNKLPTLSLHPCLYKKR